MILKSARRLALISVTLSKRQIHLKQALQSGKCPVNTGYHHPPPEHTGKYKIYKALGLAGMGVVVILSLVTFLTKKKHCEEDREPFHKFEHLRRRSKPFPWRDGVKSLFHSPETNALPDGYEEELEKCDETK